MTARLLRSAVAAVMLLLALSATVALAGGAATIVADDARPPEPRAGEEVEFGFSVMQHGVTPAGWEQPTVHATNTLTGETFAFAAEPQGPDGHFVAMVRVPTAGLYEWSVELTQLEVLSPPILGTVLRADGSRPSVDVEDAFTAIETAKRTLSMELREEFSARLDTVERSLDGLRAQDGRLRGELREAIAERDLLATRVGELEANPAASEPPGSVPVIGIVSLAVLAGALAGFAMAWLGTRRDPVQVDPAPAGTRPTTA